MSCGRYFEELGPGRTITDFEDTVQLDEYESASVGYRRVLRRGQATWPPLGRWAAGDQPGDWDEPSRYRRPRTLPDQRGLVSVSTRGLNQPEETILTLDRKIVVPKRPAGEPL